MALAQRLTYASNPFTIDEVIDIVKQYAAGCSEDVLKRVTLNVLNRAKLCLGSYIGVIPYDMQSPCRSKVAKLLFWSQKIRNVLKRMQQI